MENGSKVAAKSIVINPCWPPSLSDTADTSTGTDGCFGGENDLLFSLTEKGFTDQKLSGS